MQEQQLHARIAVLQQQAQSAVAAASKTQREVRRFRGTALIFTSSLSACDAVGVPECQMV